MRAAVEMLGAWTWIVAGLLLLGLEVLLPGTFFLWFGVSAVAVGIAALLLPTLQWQVEVIAFVVLAVVLVVVGRRFYAGGFGGVPAPGLNERAMNLVGRETVLSEPLVDGRGRIRVDDTVWRVTGPDMPSGSRVRVIGADGSVLRVTRLG